MDDCALDQKPLSEDAASVKLAARLVDLSPRVITGAVKLLAALPEWADEAPKLPGGGIAGDTKKTDSGAADAAGSSASSTPYQHSTFWFNHTSFAPTGSGAVGAVVAKEVNDLHVEFNVKVTVVPNKDGLVGGFFDNWTGNGSQSIDLYRTVPDGVPSTLPAGDSIGPSFESKDQTPIKIVKWWWTKDGAPVAGGKVTPAGDLPKTATGDNATAPPGGWKPPYKM